MFSTRPVSRGATRPLLIGGGRLGRRADAAHWPRLVSPPPPPRGGSVGGVPTAEFREGPRKWVGGEGREGQEEIVVGWEWTQ
eukprot:1190272-Prorocentrum_minimum.AAC.1